MMYACIHTVSPVSGEELRQIASEFSPLVEQTSADTVVFSIDPLRKMLGSPYQIASEICRAGYEHKLQANLAIASNPDTAILLACHLVGVTLVTPGEEHLKLAPISLASLIAHTGAADDALLELLHRWGLKTCDDLAALPERGVAERLGNRGVFLRNLARGKVNRPLRISAPETSYEDQFELEHPLELLEPLLFLLGSGLGTLCSRLRSQSRAARILEAKFALEGKQEYCCELEFPVPLTESQTMLKLLQLHLERHPPSAPIHAVCLRLSPVEPKRIQHGIFLPPSPSPDKLQVTLARIGAMVGKENVGTPALLNTHRPDAFAMTTLNSEFPAAHPSHNEDTEEEPLRLAMRLYRPALRANVRLAGVIPQNVIARGIKGKVLQYAGPWKTSGEWWASTAWAHEEWDVALDDGALYRIYRKMQTHEWYVHATYD